MMKISPPYVNYSQALSQSLQALVQALCGHFQIDASLVIPAVLGMCSALVHDKYKIRVHDYVTGSSFDEPLSLFCIAVASSSERKSPLLKWLKAPVQEELECKRLNHEKKLARLLCERKIAEDEAKKLRRKLTRILPDSPQRQLTLDRLLELEEKIQQYHPESPRLFLQDTTAIAAADFMQKQAGNSLMIADAEGGSFDSILSDHRLLELLLSGFSNEHITFERSSRASIDIASPHAGLCILTQEVKLHKLAKKKTTWDEGFIPRSLIFLVREMAGFRSTPIGEEVPQSLQNWWKEKCVTFLNLEHQKGRNNNREYHILHLSPEAAQVWREFSGQLEGMMQPGTSTYNLRAWLGKMSGVAARIAAIFHLFEAEKIHGNTISAQSMYHACNMIFAIQLHMTEVARLYFPEDSTFIQAVHKLVNWLKQEAGTVMHFKLREMYRLLNIDSKLAHAVCGYLANLGVLQQSVIQEFKKGRNGTPVFIVNYYSLNEQFPNAQYY